MEHDIETGLFRALKLWVSHQQKRVVANFNACWCPKSSIGAFRKLEERCPNLCDEDRWQFPLKTGQVQRLRVYVLSSSLGMGRIGAE